MKRADGLIDCHLFFVCINLEDDLTIVRFRTILTKYDFGLKENAK